LRGVSRIGLYILWAEERMYLGSRTLRSIRRLLEHSEEEATPLDTIVPDPHTTSELLDYRRLARRQH
jgi:hypothetical protein